MPALKVSVVVPVWNPGPNIQRCLDGLLAQTMPAEEYELVFVDDGSADGTGELLDALARRAAGPHLEVVHIPNSGWPGRPRNVGVSTARGEYVHFVDNDDTLAPTALEALYDTARRGGDDIVIGKPASNFRSMTYWVYRRNISGTTLAQSPWLVETLTPHKLFRRAFLNDHDIRHPEGPVPFEDQIFVMQAYVHARSISVLADRACYYYLGRIGSGRHAGDRRLDAEQHCDSIRKIVDIVDQGIADPTVRVRLLRRFYRTGVVGPLTGRAMLDWDATFRQRFTQQLRALGAERFGPAVHEASGAAIRAPGRLLAEEDTAALAALAERFEQITLHVEIAPPYWDADTLRFEVDGHVALDGEPLRCEPADGGWALPAGFAPGVPTDDRVLDVERNDADVEVSIVSRVDHVSFALGDGVQVAVADDGTIRVRGTVSVDPMTAMGGVPLTDGVWDLRVRLSFAGLNRTSSVRLRGDAAATPPLPAVSRAGTTVVPYWTSGRPVLAVDVGQWGRPVAAVAAAHSTVTAGARGAVVVEVPIRGGSGADLPRFDLFFRPVGDTAGGLMSVPAQVDRAGANAVSAAASPKFVADGTWRVWLAITDSAAAPVVELPWLVHRTERALRAERVPQATDDAVTSPTG